MRSKTFASVWQKQRITLTKYARKIPRPAKYLIVIFLISLLLLRNVDIIGYAWLNENFRNPYSNEDYTFGTLRDDLTSCFMESAKETMIAKHISEGSDHSKISPIMSNGVLPPLLKIVSEFSKYLSSLHVKAAIIEPSVLYCMLLPQHQKLLLKRKFNITAFLGSKNVFTFGILSKDVRLLQKEVNIAKLSASGYQPYFVQVPVTDWMRRGKQRHFAFETFASHIFYKQKYVTFHLVVFQERANYLWHAEYLKNNSRIPPKNELLFVNHNGAYEKFAFIQLKTKVDSFVDIYIPSMPHYFLFQMLSSRFLECDSSRSANLTSENDPNAYRDMSIESFNRRTVVTIHQLKTIFHPLLMNLWIWSGTMLGWYRQCDIIPYTTDVDMAAWASEVDDVTHIINSLLNNKYVTIKHRMGLYDEALEFQLGCYGLQTDIFFMYRIHNGSWCSGHNIKGGYYFRYFYPHFTLCSAELLGQKVQVPCETEKVIANEYGPSWSKPVSSWSYERSTSNRGPNIYWDTKKLKDSYLAY